MTVIPFRRPEPKTPEELSEPVLVGPAICLACRNQWEARVPVGTWKLECPRCHTNRGVLNELVEAAPGDAVHRCACGSEALTAYYRDSVFWLRCMGCGSDHTQAIFDPPK